MKKALGPGGGWACGEETCEVSLRHSVMAVLGVDKSPSAGAGWCRCIAL